MVDSLSGRVYTRRMETNVKHELSQPGNVGLYLKVKRELRDACRQYGINVTKVVREALVHAVIQKAGESKLEKANAVAGRPRRPISISKGIRNEQH